jgi:death-on-curing protein
MTTGQNLNGHRLTGPDPAKLSRNLLLAIHDEQLAEHGGRPGLRHAAPLDAALAAAGERMPEAAARCAMQIIRGRPFTDGNLRTGFVALELLLALNGCMLAAGDIEATLTLLRLASGELDEPGFIAWVAAHTRPARPSS